MHLTAEATAINLAATTTRRVFNVSKVTLNTNDKPTGAEAGWQLIETRTRFDNKTLTLRDDKVRVNGGKELDYAYLERAGAVIVVPVTREGEIVVLRQYRYAVDEWCLEVPAGGTHDTDDATLEQVARKELREEIGGEADALRYVTFFYSANAFSDEKCHVFLAEGVRLSEKPDREETESITMQRVPAAELFEMVQRGEMKTAPCALAVMLCEPLVLGRRAKE